MFKRYLLTAAIAAALTACGGGGGSSNSSSGNPSNPAAPTAPSNQITIAGTATAPGATVALLRQQNLFEVAMNMLIPPAAAAVIGLEPVRNATVELIRVDNTGAQVGEVLATTVTSLTGDYTLTLPTGVDLSGDLIVRITGTGGVEMRAQVVDRAVDISPVSEFVLRKFIASGTDLKTIAEGDVVKLSGRIEEFDLTAGADMSEMLAKLEAEVGEFVDNQIDTIASTESDATTLDGNYRSSAYAFQLHDSDDEYSGSFAIDIYHSDFVFDGNDDGSVAVNLVGEEAAWASLHGGDPSVNLSLHYAVEIEEEEENLSATLDSANVLTIESAFEEEIDGEWGWRWMPATYRVQKVRDSDTLFLVGSDASVRYATVDTDGNGSLDAVDPEQRSGDEVNRSIEVFFKAASELSATDLTGTFGRIYLGTFLNSSGTIEVEAEANEMVFNGDNTINIGAAAKRTLRRTTSGASVYEESGDAGEAGFAITTLPNGIDTTGDSNTDGFVNSTADFIAFTESEGDDGTEAFPSLTWLVKLPTVAPTVTGKTYRLLFLETALEGQSIDVRNSRFRSTITWSSETAGTAAIETGSIFKNNLQGNIALEGINATDIPVSIEIAANGRTEVVITEADGDRHILDGYLNATGSYGIFQSRILPEGADDPIALGVAVLVELPTTE